MCHNLTRLINDPSSNDGVEDAPTQFPTCKWRVAAFRAELFGVDPLDFISDQVIKNDDIVAVFPDRVYCSERGAWTKTEDVDENQVVIYKAATSPRYLDLA